MKLYLRVVRCLVVLSVVVGYPFTLHALPINALIAIPAAQGELTYTNQIRVSRATHHLSIPDFGIETDLALNTLVDINFIGYGVTKKFSLVAFIPLVYSDFSANPQIPDAGLVSNKTFGVADLPFFLRYEIFGKDWFHQTMRLAYLAGIEIPSGDNPFTSNSVDFTPGGLIFSWQTTGWEIDWDARYQVNTSGTSSFGGHAELGDLLIYDVAFTRRLFPWTLPQSGIPMPQLNLVFEINGLYGKRDQGGADNPDAFANTGGNTIFASPGINIIMHHYSVDLGVQIPIVQDLHGDQLKTSITGIIDFGYLTAF
jgi:hypothetical protein